MSASAVYVAIGVIALLAVAVLALALGRRPDTPTITPLTGLSFGLVVAGVVFGESRAVGYTFFAAGVGLAVLDMLRKRGQRGPARAPGDSGHGAGPT